MKFPRYASSPIPLRLLSFVCLALAVTGPTSDAYAQFTETVLHSFTGLRDGGEPTGNLLLDSSGNIYGTAAFGGVDSGNIGCSGGRCGVVFKLSPNGNGGWNETLLHLFSGGADGLEPWGLVFDAAGNLYGTTIGGGNANDCGGLGCGVVYKLSPNGKGGWGFSVLYTFTGGSDGANPNAGLVFDSAGNLYGTAWGGGSSAGSCANGGCGVVFKLSRIAGMWEESAIYTFLSGNDGSHPAAPVILDQAGNLYGTTYNGGEGLGGTAFKLSRSFNGIWNETILHAFTGGADGGDVNAGLIRDAAGNLYGTTLFGGSGFCSNCGVVYQLSPTTNGSWQQNVLYNFTGKFGGDGATSYAPLVLDVSSNLYGTTEEGGNFTCINGTEYCGVVFKLSPSSSGWSESVVYSFSGKDGANPLSGLTLDAFGNFWGTTRFGGTSYTACANAGCGVVFELIP